MQVLGYRADPNEMTRGELTVNVEFLAYVDTDPEYPMMRKTFRMGRTAIVIEGADEKIQPYLLAVESLMAERGR